MLKERGSPEAPTEEVQDLDEFWATDDPYGGLPDAYETRADLLAKLQSLMLDEPWDEEAWLSIHTIYAYMEENNIRRLGTCVGVAVCFSTIYQCSYQDLATMPSGAAPAKSPVELCGTAKSKLRHEVRLREERCLALIAQEKYAQRFLRETNRKCMEIRSQALSFVKEGEKFALLSVGQGTRHVLGILEFQSCTKIMNAEFEKYASMHQVTAAEMRTLQKHEIGDGFFWGWQLELVHVFDPPLKYTKAPQGEVTWIYLDLDWLRIAPSSGASSMTTGSEAMGSSLKRSSTEIESSLTLAEVANDAHAEENETSETLAKRIHTSNEVLEHAAGSTDKDAEVTCLILQKREWECLTSGSSCLLRPFNCWSNQFAALIHESCGYSCVGILTLASCTPFNGQDPRMTTVQGVYSKVELDAFKQNKNLYFLALEDIAIFVEPSQLPWVDTAWRRGSVGRAYISRRRDTMSERQRQEANQARDMCISPNSLLLGSILERSLLSG